MQFGREFVALIGFGILSVTSATARETGFLNRIVSIDGVEYRYQVYVPREFQPTNKLPIIVALHGSGESGRDGLLQTDVGLGHAIRQHADRFPVIVVFPQAPPSSTRGFQAIDERIALAELDKSLSEFSADASRVYLTGLSSGGNGAWKLAYDHGDRFAALVVVSGFVSELTDDTDSVHYSAIAANAKNPYWAVAQRVSGLPIWIFHGDEDRIVPVEHSRRMVAALRANGADVRYTELRGVGHDAWEHAYESVDLIAWLFRQKRR